MPQPLYWRQRLQAPTLPIQLEHLHAKRAIHAICLEPLPNGQRLLNQLFAVHKAAIQDGTRGLDGCRLVEVVGLVHLVRQPGEGGELCVHPRHTPYPGR